MMNDTNKSRVGNNGEFKKKLKINTRFKKLWLKKTRVKKTIGLKK